VVAEMLNKGLLESLFPDSMEGLLSLVYGLQEQTTSHNQSQGTFSIYFVTAGSAGYFFLEKQRV
jgi:hypothetical protein